MKPAAALLAAAAALPALAALAACGPSSTGAPPVRICGTTLYAGDSGADVTDGTGTGTVNAVVTGGAADLVIVRLAAGCAHGATYTLSPAGAVRVTAVAHSRDGRTTAVVLQLGHRSALLGVWHPDGSSGLVRVAPFQ